MKYTTVTQIEDQLRYIGFDNKLVSDFDIRDIFTSYKDGETLISVSFNTIDSYDIKQFKLHGFKFSHVGYNYSEKYKVSALFSFDKQLI